MTLVAAIEEALRAPSVHNSQPWRFRRLPDGRVEVLRDERAWQPVADPARRQLIVSQGTFAASVLWAGRGLGLAVTFEPGVASLILEGRERGSGVPSALEAVRQRQTARVPFSVEPLAPATREALETVSAGLASVVVVDEREQLGLLARVVETGTRRAFADRAFREELAARLGAGSDESSVLPPAEGLARVGRWVQSVGLTHVDPGAAHAREAAGLVEASAAVVLVVTDGDDERAWLDAGVALGSAWLEAHQQGLSAQPMTAAIESSAEREVLSRALGGASVQAMLRVGHALTPLPPRTARRPLPAFWTE